MTSASATFTQVSRVRFLFPCPVCGAPDAVPVRAEPVRRANDSDSGPSFFGGGEVGRPGCGCRLTDAQESAIYREAHDAAEAAERARSAGEGAA